MKSRTNQRIARLLSGLLLAAPLLTAHAVDQSATPVPQNATRTPVAHHKSHKKPTPLVLPPLPAGPLPQVPMTQLPASAPRVTYQNGLLAIAAQNSTLGEILRDVRKLTGASIEVPQAAAGERVVAQVGPGAPRDVLALLLNGTPFNYVMMGSASDPSAVASIALSLKPSSGEVQTAANVPTNSFQPGQPQPVFRGGIPMPRPFRQPPGVATPGSSPDAQSDDNTDDSDTSADDSQDDSEQSQPAQPVVVQPDASAQPDQQAVDPNQPNGGPKTPEQLLQLMRRAQPPGNPSFPNTPPPQ
ncbi:MAG: hypothetical protein WA172_12845 [Terriglobales bacterium]